MLWLLVARNALFLTFSLRVRPVDLLGRTLHRSCIGCIIPPDRDQGDPIQVQSLGTRLFGLFIAIYAIVS